MMNTIKLSNHFQSNATLVSNYFIDNYMATANGEFVKFFYEPYHFRHCGLFE